MNCLVTKHKYSLIKIEFYRLFLFTLFNEPNQKLIKENDLKINFCKLN